MMLKTTHRAMRISLAACALAAATMVRGHEPGPEYIAAFDTTLEIRESGALAPDPWVVGLGLAALLVGVFVPLIYFELFKAPARRAGPRQGGV